jgi:hypothetical protein
MISPTPIFRIDAVLADVLPLGNTPYGERRMIGILGGRVGRRRLADHPG